MAIPSLLGSYIDETYQRLVQYQGGEFADGTGSAITFGTTNTGSLLLTASIVGGNNASNQIQFTKGDGSPFIITVATGSGGIAFPYTGSAIITGSLVVTGSTTSTLGFTGSLFGTATTASYILQAESASYASNGGVTQLLAGPNVTLSPTTGVGQVTVSSTSGGGGFNTATGSYGSFYSTQTQTNVAGTARSMSLNTTDITNGVSISGSTNPYNTYIKTENAGVYDIHFSAQVDKTDSGTDEIWIWIRKNGTDLSDTATSVQLTGNGAHYVAAWNFFVNSAANDYFQLMWYSPDANVRLHAEPAFGVVPGTPSLIVTANRVDQFLSNTGSFSGSFTGNLFGTASYVSGSVFTSTNPALSASYALSSSNALSSSYSITASNTILQAILLANQTVGGVTQGTSYAVGTSLESIVRNMLIAYIPPTLSSLSLKIIGTPISLSNRDVNNPFTVNTASFSATADNPNGNFPYSSSFTSSGADVGTINYYFGNNVLGSTNNLGLGATYTINKATTAGTVTFRVRGKRSDTLANITDATTSVNFYFRNYLGASSTIVSSNGTAQAVVNTAVDSLLTTSQYWTATCTADNDILGNYTYIIYPSSYGDLSSIIQNGSIQVLTAFTKLGDYTVTNAYAASINVRVYKSNADKAFASGVTLQIS
tara:strand:- start:932 stop:2890 length:1959 start_codon:yes stop_codon:yes gene_type:complete